MLGVSPRAGARYLPWAATVPSPVSPTLPGCPGHGTVRCPRAAAPRGGQEGGLTAAAQLRCWSVVGGRVLVQRRVEPLAPWQDREMVTKPSPGLA